VLPQVRLWTSTGKPRSDGYAHARVCTSRAISSSKALHGPRGAARCPLNITARFCCQQWRCASPSDTELYHGVGKPGPPDLHARVTRMPRHHDARGGGGWSRVNQSWRVATPLADESGVGEVRLQRISLKSRGLVGAGAIRVVSRIHGWSPCETGYPRRIAFLGSDFGRASPHSVRHARQVPSVLQRRQSGERPLRHSPAFRTPCSASPSRRRA
jgi:hypothetical protein